MSRDRPNSKNIATQPKPGDRTLECPRKEPQANWFGPSMEPQEEFISDGIRASDLSDFVETGSESIRFLEIDPFSPNCEPRISLSRIDHWSVTPLQTVDRQVRRRQRDCIPLAGVIDPTFLQRNTLGIAAGRRQPPVHPPCRDARSNRPKFLDDSTQGGRRRSSTF